MKPRPIPARIAVDFHAPLPDHDKHWALITIGLVLICWICCLVALHWALS